MPDPIEPQLDELRRKARRRLIGAIVLALAAAVLVPMLLESDPKPLGEDVSVKIPPVDDSKFVSKLGDKGKAGADKGADAKAVAEPPKPVPEAPKAAAELPKAEGTAPMSVPVAAPAPAKDAASAAPPPSRTLAQAEQRVISPSTKPAAPADAGKPALPAPASEAPKSNGAAKASEPAKTEEPPKAASASVKPVESPKAPEPAKSAEPVKSAETAGAAEAAKAGAYSVQLAAFADDKGANALAGKLKKAGHPAYIEPHETSRGRVFRVRVGPFPSREAAETARVKLKAEGHNGILAAVK
jgi:DedD protein